MTIMVNGVAKELEAIGKNGIEWTNDLLGNYGALHYDEDSEQYTMTEDELDEDARAEYETECWPSDLDDEAKARLEWLKNHAA